MRLEDRERGGVVVEEPVVERYDNVPPTPAPAKDPGAILDVSMSSQVGVLLDEVPMSIRDRVAATLIAEPPDFWTARARARWPTGISP